MQLDVANMIGLSGAIIAGVAYWPQVAHLITEHCSAGISIRAYAMWFIAAILITINAVMDNSIAFIVLGVVQIVATAIIFIFSKKYDGQSCPTHGGAGQ